MSSANVVSPPQKTRLRLLNQRRQQLEVKGIIIPKVVSPHLLPKLRRKRNNSSNNKRSTSNSSLLIEPYSSDIEMLETKTNLLEIYDNISEIDENIKIAFSKLLLESRETITFDSPLLHGNWTVEKVKNNRKNLVNYESFSDQSRVRIITTELSSRVCPIFNTTPDAEHSVTFVEKFVQSSCNAEFLFEYIKDLDKEQHPLDYFDNKPEEIEEEENEGKEEGDDEIIANLPQFDKKNNCAKNKRIVSMVRGLVLTFNRIDVDLVDENHFASLVSENHFASFSFYNLFQLLKCLHHQEKTVPMLMALVWSVYKTKPRYYGEESPFPKSFYKQFTVCEQTAAPIILNNELIFFQDLCNKSWERKAKVVRPKRIIIKRKRVQKEEDDDQAFAVKQAQAITDRDNRQSKRAKNNDGQKQLTDNNEDSTTNFNSDINAEVTIYQQPPRLPPTIDQLFKDEKEGAELSIGTKIAIKIMEKKITLPEFADFFSEYLIISDILLYIIGQSIYSINLIVFNNGKTMITMDDKVNLWKSVQHACDNSLNLNLKQVSLVDLGDFDKQHIFNDGKTDRIIFKNNRVRFLRASTLLYHYEEDDEVHNVYSKFFIKLFHLDKVLITNSREDADILWAVKPEKYCTMTLDGFKKNFQGIIKLSKAFEAKTPKIDEQSDDD